MRTKLRPLDVLVIVTVLLVVGSLVVPALVELRNQARRTNCERNLAALGKAMLSYHELERTFPPGIIAGGEVSVPFGGPAPSYVALSKRCDNPGIAQTSALTLILPFLDEERTYMACNRSLAACAIQNATAVATKVRVFVCPANGFENTGWGYFEAPRGLAVQGPATTDYALSVGGTGLISDDYPHGAYPKYHYAGWNPVPGQHGYALGIFNVNWAVSRDWQLKDGAAKTFMMGESYSGARAGLKSNGQLPRGNEALGDRDSSVVVATPWSQGFLGSEPQYGPGQSIENFGGYGSVFAATAWNAWYGSSGNLTDPGGWFALLPNKGGLDRARASFCRAPRPIFTVGTGVIDGTRLTGELGSVQGFRSKHSTQPMLFADGSVRQIKPNIDPKIWVGLSTVRGGEEIPDDF